MVTCESFSNIELHPAESDQRWFMASADFRNTFHCLLIPPSLGRYFSLPACSAKWAGLVGRRVEGRTLAPSDLASPFPASLPMVSAGSMHFCQDAALRIAAEAGIQRCIPAISYRSWPVLLSSDHGENWSHGPRYHVSRWPSSLRCRNVGSSSSF